MDADAPDDTLGEGLFREEMSPGSSLAHLYRGEVHRMNYWRERLDRTTNWAVIAMVGVLTWSFSSRQHPHYILLLGMTAIGMFLFIEARRYRGYDMWRGRVRTLQQNVIVPALDPSESVAHRWRQELAQDYRQPRMKITWEESLAHRLRRIYLPLLMIIAAAWIIRITAFAGEAWPASAAVGKVPGLAVTVVVAVLLAVMIIIALRPRTWRTHGELLDEDVRTKHADGPAP